VCEELGSLKGDKASREPCVTKQKGSRQVCSAAEMHSSKSCRPFPQRPAKSCAHLGVTGKYSCSAETEVKQLMNHLCYGPTDIPSCSCCAHGTRLGRSHRLALLMANLLQELLTSTIAHNWKQTHRALKSSAEATGWDLSRSKHFGWRFRREMLQNLKDKKVLQS